MALLKLRGKKVGIIGFGNVGERFSEIALGLGMKVSVYSESFDSRKDNYPNIIPLNLSELISESDIITFHCKPPKDKKAIINIEELKLMKKNSVIINTARGDLINEKDLKTALEQDIIRGAALDVFSDEPAKDNILFGCKNLILTPHIAASTIESQLIVAEMIALQISDFFNKGLTRNTV